MNNAKLPVNKSIEQLLEENRHFFDGKAIAFDGIVDEDTFYNSKIKTLFLMKEVNDEGMKEDWRTFMEDTKNQAYAESMYKTWPNLCMWVEALKNPNTSFSDCVDEYGYFATKKLQKNILDVAIVNIKKTAGGGSSEYEQILEAATSYGHITCAQIEQIDPNLVVCGGTFDFARIMYNVTDEEVYTLKSGTQYFIRNNIMFLKFVHPMWFSVNRNILFAYAKEVFRDVREYMNI